MYCSKWKSDNSGIYRADHYEDTNQTVYNGKGDKLKKVFEIHLQEKEQQTQSSESLDITTDYQWLISLQLAIVYTSWLFQ